MITVGSGLRPGLRILVASEPVDFRKGLDGMVALVERHLCCDPFGGDLFVFRSKRADRVKIVAWDGTGLFLFYKRLEQGRCLWPPLRQGTMVLTTAQLAMLLEGLDWLRGATNLCQTPGSGRVSQ
ncbi:MAG: IS66 family insertion sequence element accessory protein TnpB [Azospirillum sp.]|nr:IS66 family insertion sequence element accessory protein TnpB [Azospirillum sp.]